MKRLALLLLLATAPHAVAQIVTATPRGIAVAHDGMLQHFENGVLHWSVDGVVNATSMAAGFTRIALLDAMANEAIVVELASGKTSRLRTAETPVAAVFLGEDLYILARDARVLQHVGGPAIEISPDPAFLAVANGRLYVYSRATGTIEEIEGDRVTRRVTVAPFASDLETAGQSAYLAFPREAKLRVVDLTKMKNSGEVAVGAVPVDLAIAGGGNAITARILAVADPSAKRVWMTESTQSTAKAFARGFLRGFIGLGFFGSRSSQFPTGVDRVARAGSIQVAYDSSSRTLYRFTKKKSSVVARDLAPGAWTATSDAIVWWDGHQLLQVK